jgi:uncharacterized protein (DUF58 family)
MEDYRKYLDPKVLNRLGHLDLKARLIVEGFVAGMHKSPHHGFSVEFAEHREYVPGDDIRHMDWKVYGRSDRYYIKQYEEETNFVAHLCLDSSESMTYRGASGVSKLEYGTYVAAALAYLIIRQQDAVGLQLFGSDVYRSLPPASHPSHLKLLLNALSTLDTPKKTDIGHILHDVAERTKRRGIVVLISDLFDDPKNVLLGLRHLRHRSHDVIVLHVLDDDEIRFPFEKMTLFEGLESQPDLLADPRALRKAYLHEFDTFLTGVRKACLENNVDYTVLNTSQNLDVALSAFLATRAGGRR